MSAAIRPLMMTMQRMDGDSMAAFADDRMDRIALATSALETCIHWATTAEEQGLDTTVRDYINVDAWDIACDALIDRINVMMT